MKKKYLILTKKLEKMKTETKAKVIFLMVVFILSLLITSCDTEPLPEPESKIKNFIGLTTISNNYSYTHIYNDEYGQQLVLNYTIGNITIDDCHIEPFNKTLGNRVITKDSIGYGNTFDDQISGNRFLIIDYGKYRIRYKTLDHITVMYY